MRRRGFAVETEGALFYGPDTGAYCYTAHTSLGPAARNPIDR